MSRRVARLLTTAGAAALLIAGTAGPALAHVTVNAPGASQGGFAVISFRVPTESEAASTVGLKVQLPADQPLAFASVRPKAGWTYTVQKTKLASPIQTDDGEITEAVSVIEWKATGPNGGIKPGEFDEFQLSAGPLPRVESMTFKAIQTYSDQSVVSWIDESAPGSTDEPEHPAPVLALAPAAAEGAPAAPGPTATAAPAAAPAGTDGASSGSVVGAYVVGILGLLAGVAGLALGMSARRRPVTVEPAASERVAADAE